MDGRRIIAGLCMLCALLVSAFAAQSASAITGTTAFTCVKEKGTLRGEHCLTSGSASPTFGHVEVAQDKTTEVITTNAKTSSETTTATVGRLKVTIGGVPLEISTTGASASGWLENKKTASGEHYVHGKGATTFTGVEVTQPAGRGCKVTTHKEDGTGNPGEEGEIGIIHTRELTATTEGQGDFVSLRAADNGNFANFWITCEPGKQIPAIEGTWSCSGIVKGVANGATVNYTHAATTEQNTLKCRGAKAGIEIGTTVSGREKGGTGVYTPLSMTTVIT